MIFAVLIISFCYIFLLIAFIAGFRRLEPTILTEKNCVHKFSIIIPFRNEASNLNVLIDSFARIDYPKSHFEILLINDESTDNYSEVLERKFVLYPTIRTTLIDSNKHSNAPKKDAIIKGIENAVHPWIVTTDADCEVPINWLHYFDQAIKDKDVNMLAGPVAFKSKNGFLFQVQHIHFSGLMGSGIGAFGLRKPFLNNGANLCYNKAHFFEVGGFKGQLDIAGGDDVLLMEKFLESAPAKVRFIKNRDATVLTQSAKSWSAFFRQQLRWAAKSKHYKNTFSKFVGIVVLLQNSLIVFLLALSLFNLNYWPYLLGSFIGKLLVDLILTANVFNFFNQTPNKFKQLIVSIFYPIFIVLVGVLSTFLRFSWKERKYKP